jgi:hypothetical protein
MIRYFERLSPVLFAIESCGSSHSRLCEAGNTSFHHSRAAVCGAGFG